MHYRNAHEKPPTYLFGETTGSQKSQNPSEIHLNKSGWIQVKNPGDTVQTNNKFNAQQQYQYTKVTSGYLPTPARPLRVENYKNISHLDPKTRQQLIKANNNKIEDLISRNDARKVIQSKNENIQDQYYGRPGFLPVKNYKDRDSPPPVTPILSPPPAFQDTKGKLRSAASNVQISVTDYENHNPKGMVFSRSFEYDNRRKNIEFNEIFSKSFDHDFKTSLLLPENRHIGQNQKSMTFSTLTGISPNYLSKRNSFEKTISKLASRSRDNSPMQSRNFLDKPDALVPLRPAPNYLEATPISYPRVEPTSVKNFTKYRSLDEPTHGGSGGRSRRAQFSRGHRESSNSSSGSVKGFRSLDAATNLRLNSCDSGARSGTI